MTIHFKEKSYSEYSKNLTNSAKSVGKYLVKHPTLPLSVTGLGLSVASFRMNKRRTKDAHKYQELQLKAMDRLTNSLNKVDRGLNKNRSISEEYLNHLHSNDPTTIQNRVGNAVKGVGNTIADVGRYPTRFFKNR